MPYDKARELADLSYQKWVSSELFTRDWFIELLVILMIYAVWFFILDKKKITQLFLLGSLSAVIFLIFDIVLYGFYGFVEYPISLTPYKPSLFVVNVTIAPVVIMTVEQYVSSWKKFILWAAIGIGCVTFVLLPIYRLLGIIEFHKHWNYFTHFLYLFVGALAARLVFLSLNFIQRRTVK